MEKNKPQQPKKMNSFSGVREERLRESDRNLSLGAIKFEEKIDKEQDAAAASNEIASGQAESDEPTKEERLEETNADVIASEDNLATISDDIDQFISILHAIRDVPEEEPDPPQIPNSIVDRFVALVENEIGKYESGEAKWSVDNEEPSLLNAIDRVSKLKAALAAFSSEPPYVLAMSRTGGVLQHAMSFLEDEFYSLLDESEPKQDAGGGASKTKRPLSFGRTNQDSDRCVLPPPPQPSESGTNNETPPPPYPTETVERMRRIAATMISAGYDIECIQLFAVARRNALNTGITELGFEKISIDDVQKMSWESLEGEIVTWIKAFRHTITTTFQNEHELWEAVFSDRRAMAFDLFCSIARRVVVQLLNFAEAVAMTKRSAEKIFKVLDMYETLRDTMPLLDGLLAGDENDENGSGEPFSPVMDLKAEISSAWARLGEAAVAIFCDLESNIKAETGRTPVPGGAVHPLTRYMMNYLKYTCEYKNTLEEVFKEHKKSDKPSSYDESGDEANSDPTNDTNNNRKERNSNGRGAAHQTPFGTQLIEVMDLLHATLESKSKLYKDLALSNIFLMNNGRYIVQKIKGSAEINQLLGDTWCRKRSSDLRQYHKNYQRETWARVLACFKDDGLHANGRVVKPVLKERLKSFSAMFEEIHKTQSAWVVSDEQLQSELRVSVSAVVVPAYRSFLGRFQQYLDPGRQTEKYIKFGPEDLESYIDDLFDGNPASMLRRRT